MLGQSSRGKDAEKGAAEDGDEGDQTDNYGLDHAGITQVLALRGRCRLEHTPCLCGIESLSGRERPPLLPADPVIKPPARVRAEADGRSAPVRLLTRPVAKVETMAM